MGASSIAARKFVLVALCALVSMPAAAQRLPLRTYSSVDGLAGDDVTALLADSRGFLWVGTTTGLSRFDGREFKNIGRAEGLPQLRVNALFEDSSGSIWIATVGGAARIERDRHALSLVDLGAYSDANVVAFEQTPDGRIWLAGGRRLFVAAEPGAPFRDVSLPAPQLNGPLGPPFSIEALAQGHDGELWIGSGAGLFRRLNDGRIARIAVRPTSLDDRVKSIAIDALGRLWITHWGLAHRPGVHFGVYVLQPHAADRAELDARTTLHKRARQIRTSDPFVLPERPGDAVYLTADSPIGDARVFGALPMADGAWLTTINGLRRIVGSRVERFATREGLGVMIQTAVQDAERNLWLGTAASGLMRLGLDEFSTYGEQSGIRRGEIAAILQDGTGSLCLAGVDVSGRGWFGRLTGKRMEVFEAHNTGGVRYWGWGWQQVFLRDRGGEFWIATGNGLLRYPAADSCTSVAARPPIAWYRKANGLPADDIFRLFEDSRRDLWISAGRLVRWRRATQNVEPVADHPDSPSVFAEDRAGNVWIGFYNGGVARWKSGSWRMFASGGDIPPGFVFTLFVDSRGRLWIGTESGGLLRVDDPDADAPRFAPVADVNLADVPIYAMMQDRDERFYVSTPRGVLRFDERRGVTRRYALADGFTGHMARTVYADDSGALWFGTREGLSRLNPGPALEPKPLPVFIDRVVVGGAPLPTSLRGSANIDGVRVEPGARRIEISYGSASLIPGATPTYAVRLSGVDPDWSSPSGDRTITYASLKPGSYRFEVRAIVDGRASASPAVVSFTVVPPMWRRQSVQLGAVLAGRLWDKPNYDAIADARIRSAQPMA